MKQSRAKDIGEQLPIWSWVGDRLIESSGQMRTVMGDWCEELVAQALSGTRHRIDSTADYCADMELHFAACDSERFLANTAVEVKSCRHAGALIFAKRLVKDQMLERHDRKRLFYAFVRSSCPLPPLPAKLSAIRAALGSAHFPVLIVPAVAVRSACRKMKPREMWKGGPVGYRLPWATIEQIAKLGDKSRGEYQARVMVYRQSARVTVQGSMAWAVLPWLSPEDREEANALLCDLDEQKLGVALVPAPRPQYQGHMVRALTGRNPEWYRKLALSFPEYRANKKQVDRSRHRPGPGIVRCRIVKALERLSKGGHPRTTIDMRLLPLIKNHRPKPKGANVNSSQPEPVRAFVPEVDPEDPW